MSRVTNVLSDLIRFNTAYPPGGTEDVISFIQGFMEKNSIATKIHPIEEDKKNLAIIGRLDGKEERTLIFNGHIDTVPIGEGWNSDPFKAEIKDGKLYGRGTTDMKGGIAAALCAAENLSKQGHKTNANIEIHIVPDEESDGKGAKYLVEKNLVKGEAAIFGEPTGLQPQIAEKGIAWIKITCHGQAAHASVPHKGVNAISKAASIAKRLEQEFPGKIKSINHRLLGTPTLNIGTIHGGSVPNIVPDQCIIVIDRRMLPGEHGDEVLSQIREIVGDEGEAELLADIQEPCEINEKENIVALSSEVVTEILGKNLGIGGFTATTDARFYVNQGKIPSLILGPGNVSQAHTANEFIDIDQLENAVKIYEEIMKSY